MEKVIKIVRKQNAGTDITFWASQSGEQRIVALEKLRNQYLTQNGTRCRLQRVCRIIERT